MSDSPTPITKQDVAVALAGLKVGRSRARGYRYVMSIMHRYGNAHHIDELDPKFYTAVFAAAGGDVITAEKIYGSVVDLPPTIVIPTPEEFYGVVLDVPTRRAKSGPPPSSKFPTRPILRLRTPMVADLEARVAARIGKPRSKPGGRVDIGAPAQFGDEDAAPQYSSDGRKMQ
jgi:hypothetical protein